MKIRRGLYFSFVLMSGVVCGCVAVSARCQQVPASSSQNPTIVDVPKPVRKADQVVTNDPIALLAVRHESNERIADAGTNAGAPDALRAEEKARKVGEIASLEQQIREKTKRITLLLRLFVDDERTFLHDPANAQVAGPAAERRQYEQDELKWETAELAKLEGRLREITAAR
jgi:hypothetical protein